MTTPHPHSHHRTSQILSLALHLSTPEEFTKQYTNLLSSSHSCSNSGSPCSLNCGTGTTQSSYSLKESQTEREEVKRSKEIKETVQRAQTTAEMIRYVVGLTTRSELVCRLGGIRHRRYQVERNGECNGDTLVECLDVDVEATEANQSETEKERVMEMEMVQENLVKFGKLLGYTLGFDSTRLSCSPLSSCDVGTFPLDTNTTPAKQTPLGPPPSHSKQSSDSPQQTQVQPQTFQKRRSRFDTPDQSSMVNENHGYGRWLDQNQLDMSSNRVDEVEQIEYSLYHNPNDDDRRQGDVDSDLCGYGSRAREHTDGEWLKYEEYREMVNGPYQNMGGSETGEIERYGDVKFEDGYEYHSHSNCSNSIQQKLPLFNESYQPQRPSPPSVSPFFKESLKTRKPSYSLLNRKTSFPRQTRTRKIKSPRPRYLNPTKTQNPQQHTDEYSQSYSNSNSSRFLQNQVTLVKRIQSPSLFTSPNLISDSPYLIQPNKTHHHEFQSSISSPVYSPSLAFTLSQPQFQSQSQFQAENDFQRQIQKDQNETTKKRPRRGSTQSTIPLPSSPLLNSTIDHDSPELDLCMQYQNEREGERDGEGECGVRGM